MSMKVYNFHIFLLYLLICLLLLRQGKSEVVQEFNCKCIENLDESGQWINFVLGTWYEIARWPSYGDSKCVEIKLSEPLNNEVKLHVQYHDKQWQYSHEVHTLPWNSIEPNHEFVINSVVYKLLDLSANGKWFTVCGYANDTQESSLYFFNRLPEGVQSSKEDIELYFEELHLNVTEWLWVDQSKRCSNAASMRTATLLITLLSVFLQIDYFLSKLYK